MLPNEKSMMWCIMYPDGLADGVQGLAIGDTELEAWERLNGGQDYAIERAKESGAKVRRCVIVILNP